MSRLSVGLATVCLVICSCTRDNAGDALAGSSASATQESIAAATPTATESTSVSADDSKQSDGKQSTGAEQTMAAEFELTSANTKVEFIGTHTGDKPDPRHGEFKELSGKVVVDGADVKSIEVEFQTASLETSIEKLTNHLKSPDFFDVRQHPTARFKSTKVAKSAAGQTQVTGDLTLLGVTKPIKFPATVDTTGGFSLTAEFTIDRTNFGMDYGADKIEKEVALKVSVGN